jgi:type III secretory pathway component EscV
MLIVLHGVAGGFDELIIAVVAVGVLWLAVKLAGRKSADDDEDENEEAEAEQTEAARPPATPLGQ